MPARARARCARSASSGLRRKSTSCSVVGAPRAQHANRRRGEEIAAILRDVGVHMLDRESNVFELEGHEVEVETRA
ncbi:MAG: hypothetical protein H0W90_07780 [Actinobacteria bacterium]|nr:hypothetical protein [Actinomycetota bacterium]